MRATRHEPLGETIEEQTVRVGTRIALFSSALLALSLLARACVPLAAPTQMAHAEPTTAVTSVSDLR
jgi:hypothetical protein